MFLKVAAPFAVLAATVSASLYHEDSTQQRFMWAQFKKEHNKVYASEEEDNSRFATFVENLKVIDARNAAEAAAGGDAVHGITKFSDLSQGEFQKRYLTSDPSLKTKDAVRVTIPTAPDATKGLVSWAGVYTTPVKDQGYCGSCWAFSATEQIESDSMRTLGTSYILSPEQINQCDKTSSGCNGGWTEHAYNYVKRAGGIEQDSVYPYAKSTYMFGVTGSCTEDSAEFVLSVSGYTTISGESSMASYVQSTGPLSVCVDANSWNSYTGGIMRVCGQSVDHCVQAVGVDASTGGYWLVRNSWGTSWGESGYIRLSYGDNTCNITDDPTYVSVSTA